MPLIKVIKNKVDRRKKIVSVILILCMHVMSSAMEQRTFKNVNNCLNANIYSYLETSGGQSSCLYLNVVHFFKASVH